VLRIPKKEGKQEEVSQEAFNLDSEEETQVIAGSEFASK
jgi:hypothetical protein